MKQKVEITFLAALALFQPLSLLENIPADVLHAQTPSGIKGLPLLVFMQIPPSHPRALPTFVLVFLECCRCWGHPGSSLVTLLSCPTCCAVLPGLCTPGQGLEEDFSQQLSFSSCSWTSWEWYKFSEEAAEPRVSPAWEGHSQGEPLPCSHLLQGG